MEKEGQEIDLFASMPKVPLDGITDAQFEAFLEFLRAWNGPICVEKDGEILIGMSLSYYKKWSGENEL